MIFITVKMRNRFWSGSAILNAASLYVSCKPVPMHRRNFGQWHIGNIMTQVYAGLSYTMKQTNIYIRRRDYTEKDKLGMSGCRVLENRISLKGNLKQNIKQHCAPHGARLQK